MVKNYRKYIEKKCENRKTCSCKSVSKKYKDGTEEITAHNHKCRITRKRKEEKNEKNKADLNAKKIQEIINNKHHKIAKPITRNIENDLIVNYKSKDYQNYFDEQSIANNKPKDYYLNIARDETILKFKNLDKMGNIIKQEKYLNDQGFIIDVNRIVKSIQKADLEAAFEIFTESFDLDDIEDIIEIKKIKYYVFSPDYFNIGYFEDGILLGCLNFAKYEYIKGPVAQINFYSITEDRANKGIDTLLIRYLQNLYKFIFVLDNDIHKIYKENKFYLDIDEENLKSANKINKSNFMNLIIWVKTYIEIEIFNDFFKLVNNPEN